MSNSQFVRGLLAAVAGLAIVGGAAAQQKFINSPMVSRR
jgi:hypothetical protein